MPFVARDDASEVLQPRERPFGRCKPPMRRERTRPRNAGLSAWTKIPFRNAPAAASLAAGLQETLTLHWLGVFAAWGVSFTHLQDDEPDGERPGTRGGPHRADGSLAHERSETALVCGRALGGRSHLSPRERLRSPALADCGTRREHHAPRRARPREHIPPRHHLILNNLRDTSSPGSVRGHANRAVVTVHHGILIVRLSAHSCAYILTGCSPSNMTPIQSARWTLCNKFRLHPADTEVSYSVGVPKDECSQLFDQR